MTGRQKNDNTRRGKLRSALLAWFDVNQRRLPWRNETDPYRIWLSEVMLQQTTVQAVIPYYTKFLEKWPTVQTLAAAKQEDVLHEWAGLGYYARARNLLACAKAITERHGGKFPDTQDFLRKLPGIGEYTSAAIAAIAFDRPAVVIDGNVERVIARLYAIRTPLPAAKAEIRKYASSLSKGRTDRPGDFAQASMELGATICIPGNPRCGSCPLKSFCKAYEHKIANELPKREKKVSKPARRGYYYWIQRHDGAVLFERRPDNATLGGMLGLPTSKWVKSGEKLSHHPIAKRIIGKAPTIRHVFTHFNLTLEGVRLNWGKHKIPAGHLWIKHKGLKNIGLPSLFKKAVKILAKG